MQVKKYVFCDCAVEIKHKKPILQKFNYSRFLCDFEKPDFSVEVIECDSLPPKTGECLCNGELNTVFTDENSTKVYSALHVGDGVVRDFACRVNESQLYVSSQRETDEFLVFEGIRLPEILLSNGIGLLHCSFIEVDGQAILFAGDKQVGKSTQASLWEKYASATVINGDRAGLFIKNGAVYAGGVPYCGTSGICVNKQMPVRAIICLSRGTDNVLKKQSPVESFVFLLGQFAYNTWNTKDVNMVSDLLTTIVENVPVYSYSCLKDESAVNYLSERI